MVYLDNAATTPLRPEALSAMLPFFGERFGNPSGSHSVARAARTAIDEARESVARDLGCDPGEVIFTANGTESDNLAILGAHAAIGGTVLCSAAEHHAVLRSCEAAGGSTVRVDPTARIDLDALSDILNPDVRVVSVMIANNEVGTLQPLAEASALVHEKAPAALVHTDAVAAVGWMDLPALANHADLVSVSAHKFGGPKGAGALVVRGGVRLGRVLHGGEQERGRRPGTHDVAAIVGMAAALSVASANREEEATRVRTLRDRLADGVIESVDGVVESGVNPAASNARDHKLPSSFHARFEGVDSEELLLLLDDAGICASAGAACASGALEPSHVLRAMGVSTLDARSAVRFSLGPTTTDRDVDYTLEVLPKLVKRLRT